MDPRAIPSARTCEKTWGEEGTWYVCRFQGTLGISGKGSFGKDKELGEDGEDQFIKDLLSLAKRIPVFISKEIKFKVAS